MLTWMRIGEDEWVFGDQMLGMVRRPLAEVYFDEDCRDCGGGWIWFLTPTNGSVERGQANSLIEAVSLVEATAPIRKTLHERGV